MKNGGKNKSVAFIILVSVVWVSGAHTTALDAHSHMNEQTLCPNKQAHMPTYPKHSCFKLWRPTPSPLIHYSCALLSIPLLSVSLCLSLSHTRTLVWLRAGECYDAVACLSSFPSCVLQGKDEERREGEKITPTQTHCLHRHTAILNEREKARERGGKWWKEKKNGGHEIFYFTWYYWCLKHWTTQNI